MDAAREQNDPHLLDEWMVGSEAADCLVTGHGAVAVEFFDAGCSRRLPWSARPAAVALLAELHSPE